MQSTPRAAPSVLNPPLPYTMLNLPIAPSPAYCSAAWLLTPASLATKIVGESTRQASASPPFSIYSR